MHCRTIKYKALFPLLFYSLSIHSQNINTPNKIGPLGTQVNTFSGNLFIPRTDIFIPSRGFNLKIAFYYNSFNYDINTGYGRGWNFQYNIRYKNDTAGSKKISWGDGREDSYKALSGGGYKTPKGFFSVLSEYQTNKFLLREASGIKMYFDNSTHKRITKMEEPNGNYIIFNYSDTLLTSMINNAGQAISFTYDASRRMVTVVDAVTTPSRTFNYSYDNNGNLTQVTDPLTGADKYTYLINGPMKTLADKNNNAVDIIYYPDYTVSEIIGCNKRQSFSYNSTTNLTVITDYLASGNNQVTTYGYKYFENLVWLTSLTSNCCGYNMTFEFDEDGNKIKETDANGNAYFFTYDSRGNLLTIKDPLSQVVTYTYSSDYNKVTSYTDAKGNVYSLLYDNAGNLVQLIVPGNGIYAATYAANGDLLSSTDPKGNTFVYHYDAYGNPAEVTGPHGYHAVLAYDARGNLLSYTDSRGNPVSAEYDILNRLKKITDPINNNIRFTYDAESNMVSFINQKNETSQVKYDASNRLVRYTDPTGNQYNFGYDAMDNLIQIKNAINTPLNIIYDSRNRLSAVTDALDNKVTINYDGMGNITSRVLPNGHTMNYSYDNLYRPVGLSDDNGMVASLVYDANNNIIRYTNALGGITNYAYDNRDRVIQMTDPLGSSGFFTYDQNDNIISMTDNNGHVTNYAYDNLNRVISFTDPNGFVINLTYDADGNVLSVKDQNNNTSAYTYDAFNRRTKTTYPDGKFIQYTYDAKGNLISKRLTDASIITYQFDTLNRIKSKTLPDGQVYSYSYDAAGRVISASNNSGTVQITYDVLNRITSETFDGRTTRYNYNVAGRTQIVIYPDSTTITKTFDIRNRLISIAKANNILVSYQYNNANLLSGKTMANGITSNYQYDFAYRLTNLSTGNGSIQNSSFTYDKLGNKKAINRLNDPSLSEQFGYDNDSRLTNYKRGATFQNTYSYDGVGNRLSANLNGVNNTYTNNNLNQLTGRNNGTITNYIYDNNGNLTYDGVFYKKYDAEGRLIKDSSSPSNILTYQYDVFGRRVQKSYNGVSLKYSYAGIFQIEERNGVTGNINSRTIFNNFLSPVVNEKNNVPYYYHQNELNSVEAITNSSGALVETWRYDVYGKPTIYDASNNLIPSSIAGNRFGFTGQEYDSANMNYRFLFRNYSPETGTFNQRDLICYEDGMGMYQYVHNNPANGIDILGLDDHTDPCAPAVNHETTSHSSEHTVTHKTEGNHTTNHHDPNEAILHTYHNTHAVTETITTTTELLETGVKVLPAMQGVNSVAGVIVGTANTAQLLTNVQNGKGTTAQNIDLGTGAVTAYEGASIPLLVVGGALTAAEAAPLAVGLGAYGVINTGTRLITGESLGERAEQIPNPPVEWTYSGKGYDYGNISWSQDVRSKSGMSWEVNHKWINIRDMIERGEYQKIRDLYHPNSDCPQNGPTGGTQHPPIGYDEHGKPIHVLHSTDPNEIIGPDGVPDKRWVSINDRLPYTILFENSLAASAPAKYVKVVFSIPGKADGNTFYLGGFGFNNQTFTVPSNTAAYYQRLDCRDSLGMYVDVTAGLDVITNQAFWEFQSIDPVTLLPPADPFKGFLQLQDAVKGNYGHAFLNFSIKPIGTAHTLDSILATAKIVFDTNDTIPTNVAKNTIDALPPTSHLNALPATTFNVANLSWTGIDDAGGSGIKSYTLYVSTDGINFTIIRSGITRTDTSFTGVPNTTYCFFVLATDRVGNTEVLRPGEIRCTYIGAAPLPVTWLYFRGRNEDKTNILEWATASEFNSKEFRLERSLDATNFIEIGNISASGNSSSTRNYNYNDLNIDRLNSSAMYYRVKQVDINGNGKYSNVVRLNYNQRSAINSIVYPNPTHSVINLVVGDASLVGSDLRLYDINGRLVEMIKLKSYNQAISMDKYVNGVYIIRLINNESIRIVKE